MGDWKTVFGNCCPEQIRVAGICYAINKNKGRIQHQHENEFQKHNALENLKTEAETTKRYWRQISPVTYII